MEKTRPKICFLADTHGLFDDRIYWKEAVSLRNHGFEVYYVLASELDEKGITTEGINYIRVKRKKYLSNRYLNFFLKKIIPGGLYANIYKQAASTGADVYHIHDLKINKIGKRLKKLKYKPKIIYDVHEPNPENIIDYHKTRGIFTVLKKIYAAYIKNWEMNKARIYDQIITTEENLYGRFKQHLPGQKVDIIYNYTDLQKSRKVLEYADKEFDAIYTGGITKLRGAFKILEAIKIACRTKPDIKVLFIGSYFPPELQQEMSEFLRQHQMEENVFLLESVPYTEITEFYNKSRIGLGIFLPIPTHRIILQIKIFEYMNFGLPIIGSNFGHIDQYINKDQVGISVDPENPQEISDALIYLLSHPEEYERFSKNGMEAIDRKYNWQFMEKRLIKIYEDL